MPKHERGCRPLLLRELQELPREIATDIAIERHIARGPEAVADGDQ